MTQVWFVWARFEFFLMQFPGTVHELQQTGFFCHNDHYQWVSKTHTSTQWQILMLTHWGRDIFKCIFLNENVWIPIKISLKFVPLGPINNIPALVQIMAWHRPGDKPLSGPMMVRLPTHICVTRPQWVNENSQGAVSIRKTVLPGVAIPMLKIRRPNGHLIFNIGIAIPR